MKKILLFATILGMAMSVAAQDVANGYYRVRNYKTNRYLHVVDNKGSVNYASTTADFGSILLFLNPDDAKSNPACIINTKHQEERKYDVTAQGTGIHKILGTYVGIRPGSKTGTYMAYGSKDGVTKYLSDGNFLAFEDEGWLSDKGTGDYRFWYFDKVDSSGDNYFGIKPAVASSRGYFHSFYAEFPFKPVSDAVKVWVVSSVDYDKGIAVMERVEGVVPGATPVLVECAGALATNNRLNLGGSGSTVKNNQLTGVYFNYDDGGGTSGKHYNRVRYNSSTMRVLGLTADGSLGFITNKSLQFIPANSCYLTVPAGAPAELKLMTSEEYAAGIVGVVADEVNDGPFDIYNINGVCVRQQATSFDGLPAGMYIVKGHKIMIK